MCGSKVSLLSFTAFCIAVFCPSSLLAQNNKDAFELYRQQIDRKFEDARKTQDRQFNQYRDSINNEFSQYLLREWANSSISEKLDSPFKPEPKPIVDTTDVTTSKPLPHVKPTDDDKIETPTPLGPIAAPQQPNDDTFTFNFYGAQCLVHVPKTKLKMNGISKTEISSAWNVLASGVFDQFLIECQTYRNKLNLCDWGVYQFVVVFSGEYFDSPNQNESALFQVYALSQLGYKIRIAIQGNKIINLISFRQSVFSAPYITIGEEEFYYLQSAEVTGEIEICDFEFPNEQGVSLRISSLPNLPYQPSADKYVKSKAFPNVAAKVKVNTNLMSFFDTYPCCSWELYASASLSQDVKDQLYPILKGKIASATEKSAVNILLNFVQTAFEYKTDDEQFGREKTFFGDEPFYYPYCDCEDRSILFAILVKDLIGLDVVLLDYPSHIATAVSFNEEVTGDYFDINGRKYIICDPTYIGAPIGKSMPEMLNLKANILRIN